VTASRGAKETARASRAAAALTKNEEIAPLLLDLALAHERQAPGAARDELGAQELLSLDGNRFSGFVPFELRDLVALTALYLSSNQLCSGIPTTWGSCPTCSRCL
jgi:hypothetical protein